MSKRIEGKLNKIAKLQDEQETLLNEVSQAFQKKFGDSSDYDCDVFIMHQSGDGWCFVWGGDNNTPLSSMPSVSQCLALEKDDFFRLLEHNSI